MITDLLFVDDQLPFRNFMILYFIVTILLAIVYKLGFARKLPILKSALVYFVLALGAWPLAFLGIALPLVEALIIAVILLVIVKIRTRRPDQEA